MTQQLAEVLAQHIRDANLVTVAAGLATVWRTNIKERHHKAAYWNYQQEAHQLLVPDADKAAILYFEERGVTRITRGVDAVGKYKADLVLIGWVNSTKSIYTPVLIERLQMLFKESLHSDIFRHIRVEFTELLPENEQLFSRYNYDTAVRKYLQKPYDAFGLRMSVTFNICSTELDAYGRQFNDSFEISFK